MKKYLIILIAALVLCIIGGGVYWWITRDVRAVRELIDNTLTLARKKPSKLAHAGVWKFTKVEEYFAPEVRISCADPAFDMSLTNENLKMLVSTMTRRIESMEVSRSAAEIEVAGDKAMFAFDAEFTGSVSGKKESFERIYQISGSAAKSDGKWRIEVLTAESIVK